MITIVAGTAAYWSDASHKTITLDLNTAEYGVIPFTSCVDGPDAHVIDVFNRAVAGEFGPIAEYVAPPPPPLPPLSARQLRLGLLAIGIRPADVAAAIAALPEGQRDTAEIEWDYASEYRRDHPLIATLGSAFGLDAGQIDAAWSNAMTL